METRENVIDKVSFRNLRETEVEKAEELVRLAFGTFLDMPDPLANPSKRKNIAHRFHQNPGNVLAAFLNDELVGANVLTRWGSFAFFGPLVVRPDLWGSNIGTRLIGDSLDVFEKQGVSNLGLFTFPDSPKHLGLYHKFGFCPRFLTPLMEKSLDASDFAGNFQLVADLNQSERETVLAGLRHLTDELHPGLDLTSEIELVDKMKLGDTLLIFDEMSSPVGFAICQSGADTEAGLDRCYVKFGATISGPHSRSYFEKLLSAIEGYAVQKKLETLEAGVNLSHPEAFDLMLTRKYRIAFIGVAMQKPNEPAYERSGTFVLDDWR
jgi:GNAT superfamily N-acetyltransferase